MAQAADHARLVAHADLAHVDAHVQAAGERPHQFAEVHAVFRLEVEDRLFAVEEVLHRHRAHLLGGLRGELLEDGHRVGGLLLKGGLLGPILVVGNANDRFELGFQFLHLLGRCLEDLVGHVPELKAAGGFDHHIVVGGDFQVPRVEPQRLRVERQVNRRNANHSAPHFCIVGTIGRPCAKGAGPYSVSRT